MLQDDAKAANSARSPQAPSQNPDDLQNAVVGQPWYRTTLHRQAAFSGGLPLCENEGPKEMHYWEKADVVGKWLIPTSDRQN